MKTIKDSVHGHIDVQGVARDLLDSSAVQRLRRIRQLGTVSLVYPSANHTRFEHSIGVYHLVDRSLSHLPIHDQRAETLRAAGLLHDIGHAPFSHNIEDVLERHIGKSHDEVADIINGTDIERILKEHDISPTEVINLIVGDGQFSDLISGELDVDRMDYLVRDAHHTGVPYGTIDHERLVRALTFENGSLVLSEGNVQTAESLLIARALMNPTVYNHHVARISKSILRQATDQLIETTDITADEVRRMDDPALRTALRNHAPTEAYANRLDTRTLFKRALWAELSDVPTDVREADHAQQQQWEQQIADRAGVAETDVIIDIPDRPSIKESGSQVIVNGEIRPLERESPLVEALREVQTSQWRLGVYAPADVRERIGRKAADVLGIDIETLINDIRGYPATLDDFRQ
ncbi:HD domain-containing protein [Salinarchaeum sp. IM2453]|uniref:HD domain-containing protein n=1 Tax=Salinarchaeum sp. IM2453 TaxID=2862870 RepID=UPI001C82EE97|nr:HD domain-containing protein [Salinarchaeum sp. IM2453]QZA87770.1 HD domain-containing protein [Salinarchaeum sp. IM2453]